MHESQRKHLTEAASKLQRAFNQLAELERTQFFLAELFPDEVQQRQDLLEIIGEQFLSVQEDMQGVEDAVGDFSRGLRQYYVGVRDEHKATQRAARARGQAVPDVVRPSPAHMTPLELFSIIDRLPDGYEFPMAAATSKGDAKAIFRRFPNYNRIDVGGVPGHDPLTYLIQDWQGNPHPPMRSVMLDGGSNYSWGNIEDVLRSVDPSAALDKHRAQAPAPPARAPKARPRAGLRLVENDLDQLEQDVAALDQPYQAPAPPPPPRSAPAPRAQVSATAQWKPKQEIGAVLLASQSSPVGFSGGDVAMISKPPRTARGERDPAVSLSNYRPRDVSGDRESWWFRYYTQDHRPGDKPVWGRVDANVDDWGVRVRNSLTANYSGDFFPMYVQLFRPERGNQPTPEGVEIGSDGRWEWHRSDPPPVTVGLPVTVSVGNSTRGGRIEGMNKKRSRIVIEVPGRDDLSGKYSWRAKSEGYWKVGNQTKWYNGVELGMARDHTALD